jgi:hypothetical protein
MWKIGAMATILVGMASSAFATTRYVDTTLVSDCTSGNYNISARNCTGTSGNAYNTIAKGVTPTVAGDTLYLRGGTYPTSQRIDLQLENKSGSAGSYITIAGYPGDSKPILRFSEGAGLYGNIKARGNRGWFVFEDLILDGTNLGVGTFWQIRDGNHDFIVRRLEIRNQNGNGLYLAGVNNVTVEDSYMHDAVSDCVVGNRWHGIYVHTGTNIAIERNTFEHMPGIGAQVFPGPIDGVTIKNNVFYGNNHCTTVNNGGFVLYASSGNITNTTITGNVIAHNGYSYTSGYGGAINPGGAGGGMRILKGGSFNFTNVLIANNTITDNTYQTAACSTTPCNDHEQGNAISILSGVSGITIQNNILTGNTSASVVNYGTVTQGYNACKSGESCGSTGKVTVAASTDCIVSLATPDYRLKQGTNPCRDAGTSTAARTAPIGVTDLGAYEQGVLSSASTVASFIEATATTMSSGLRPLTGITGFSVACGGGSPCSGTPVVTSAIVKDGAGNIVQLGIAGLTHSGTCTISLGSTNATDSGFVGGPNGTAQGLNAISGMSVSGECANTYVSEGMKANYLWQ